MRFRSAARAAHEREQGQGRTKPHSSLLNAAQGSTNGGYLVLDQYATGGAGGDAAGIGGAGIGGAASSSMTFYDSLNATQSRLLDVNIAATGGAGGVGFSGSAGAAGGAALAVVNLSASQVKAVVASTGGAGGPELDHRCARLGHVGARGHFGELRQRLGQRAQGGSSPMGGPGQRSPRPT